MSVISIDGVPGAVKRTPKLAGLFSRLASAIDRVVEHRLRLRVPEHALRRAEHDIKSCRHLVHRDALSVGGSLDRDRPRHTMQTAAHSRLQVSMKDRQISYTVDLSESRAYDSALEILGAYKLTGNFPIDLQIVLKDLGVLDKITYEIEPKSPLSDSRHVVFRSNDNVHMDRFIEIMRSIEAQIGFDATLPWWVRLFR
jgi:hypothetical protein